jgi:hypothetical protein
MLCMLRTTTLGGSSDFGIGWLVPHGSTVNSKSQGSIVDIRMKNAGNQILALGGSFARAGTSVMGCCRIPKRRFRDGEMLVKAYA